MIIVLFVLIWSLILLALIHFHLSRRDDLIFSSQAELLKALSTLIPAQAKEIGETVVRALGYYSVPSVQGGITIEPDGTVKSNGQDKVEGPITPPWDIVSPPDEVKPGWQ